MYLAKRAHPDIIIVNSFYGLKLYKSYTGRYRKVKKVLRLCRCYERCDFKITINGSIEGGQVCYESPMESELVALTDNIGFVELFEEFFCFLTNIGSPVVLSFIMTVTIHMFCFIWWNLTLVFHLRFILPIAYSIIILSKPFISDELAIIVILFEDMFTEYLCCLHFHCFSLTTCNMARMVECPLKHHILIIIQKKY